MVRIGDDEATVGDLRRAVAAFVAARDWEQFHTPQHLSTAIATEAAELMEQFQWLTNEEAAAAMGSEEARAAVRDELADVLIYGLGLANALGLSVTGVVLSKLERNEERFPAEAWRGRTHPVDEGDGAG